jgi:hypothetical protein
MDNNKIKSLTHLIGKTYDKAVQEIYDRGFTCRIVKVDDLWLLKTDDLRYKRLNIGISSPFQLRETATDSQLNLYLQWINTPSKHNLATVTSILGLY